MVVRGPCVVHLRYSLLFLCHPGVDSPEEQAALSSVPAAASWIGTGHADEDAWHRDVEGRRFRLTLLACEVLIYPL